MQTFSAIVSALHVLPAIGMRAAALRGLLDASGLKRVFAADTAWAVAALLWVTTGPARAFGPLEKGTSFYLGSGLFYLKMGLFLLVVLLELRPMLALMAWRRSLRQGVMPDVRHAPLYARISRIQSLIVTIMVFVAAFMARGFWRLG